MRCPHPKVALQLLIQGLFFIMQFWSHSVGTQTETACSPNGVSRNGLVGDLHSVALHHSIPDAPLVDHTDLETRVDSLIVIPQSAPEGESNSNLQITITDIEAGRPEHQEVQQTLAEDRCLNVLQVFTMFFRLVVLLLTFRTIAQILGIYHPLGIKTSHPSSWLSA